MRSVLLVKVNNTERTVAKDMLESNSFWIILLKAWKDKFGNESSSDIADAITKSQKSYLDTDKPFSTAREENPPEQDLHSWIHIE